MNLESIIKLLRDSLFIQDPEVIVVDEDFLQMADEDFIPIIKMCLGRTAPTESIDSISSDNVYPLILLAKIELYHRLAVKSSPDYSITSATGVQLKKGDVFEHYYKLIEQAQKEYTTYLATGIVVKSADILLDTRYFTQRNYNLAKKPTISLTLDTIYTDKVEVSWGQLNCNKFARYNLYISKEPIFDKYDNKVKSNATKVVTISDIHTKLYRISNLTPDTKYYVLLEVEERNGLKGYSEVDFTTSTIIGE